MDIETNLVLASKFVTILRRGDNMVKKRLLSRRVVWSGAVWCGKPKSIQLDRGSATNLPVLAKCYVIWAVRGQFWPLAQLVSSSKFKLVCQLVNAKKPKKSRVTHLQLKGVIELYYWHEKTQTLSFKTSYLCWIIVSYYTKVHCLQKNIMCRLIIKIVHFTVLFEAPLKIYWCIVIV